MKRATRLALMVLCAISAPGDAFARQDAPIFRDLDTLPADIDSIMVVEGAAGFRESEIGLAISETMDSYVTLARTREAWQGFSEMLGMDEAQAFDAVFGSHFALLTRDAAGGARPSGWTLVCDVDARTGRILRKELRAAPRTIIKGVPVLSIEDGRFEMAVLSRAGRDRMLLAPRDSVELLREIATALANGVVRPFSETEQADRLRDMVEGNAFFWRRGLDDRESWLAGVFTIRPKSIQSRLIAKVQRVETATPAHSLDIFAAIEEGALFATVETLESSDEQNPMSSWIFGDAQARVEGAFRTIRAERSAALILEHPQGGLSFAVSASVEEDDDTARLIDKAMNQLLAALSVATGGGVWDFDFAGLRPEAERIADLSAQNDRQFALLGDEHLVVRWEGHGDGWWTASTPGPSGSVLRGAIDNEQAMVRRPWLSVGVVRPAALLTALDRVFPEIPRAFDGMRRVDSIVWTSWRQKKDEIWARIEVRAH